MTGANGRDKLANTVRDAKNSIPTVDVLATQPFVRLRYSIAEASSYSGIYEPHNILYDRPQDLTSRWSGAAVASIDPNSSSSNASGSGGSASPSSLAQRSSSPLSGARDGNTSSIGGSASATMSNDAIAASRKINGKAPQSSGQQHAGDKQYIILKLDKLSILRKIYFGKYHKPHPCNLKDFKVYASQSIKDARSKGWVRILRGGLRNDSQTEGFDVVWTNGEGVPFPIRYVKLVPLATHSPNYNFSVWHIALEGISDRYTVERVMSDHQENRESTAIRLILKHLRGRAYHSAFQTLLQSCKLDAFSDGGDRHIQSHKRPFEHALVTQLFRNLMQGSWDAAEECLEKAAWGDMHRSMNEEDEMTGGGATKDSLFSDTSSSINSAASLFASYVDRSMPKAKWTQIVATDNDGDSPCGRGGHEMELDGEKGIIWLFGGWDGGKDLSDLWAYYIDEGKWRCISRDVRNQGGPSPRSCHKMVFDPRTGFLYVLGRFIDYDKVQSQSQSTATMTASIASNSLARNTNVVNSGSATLVQRGISPSDRPSEGIAPPQPLINRSATRGFFLPRVAGSAQEVATLSQPSQHGNAEGSGDLLEELFGSSRGGSTRLSSGRTSFLNVDRGMRGNEGFAIGASSPNTGSPTPQSGHSLNGYESDFYRFSTRTERWDRLSLDTHAESGPKLIFDHQMIIDPDTQLIYVFGGRVVHPDSSKVELSGMWKYDVIQRSWTFLFDDLTHAQSRIPSRVGHTMLLDTLKRGSMAGRKMIWILAGQRNNLYLADMWTYSPSTGAVREICKDSSLVNGPEGGFTQRAAIDSNAREIYLFSGLVKRSKNRGEKVKSAFWIYSIERGDWRLVYQYGGLGSRAKREGSSDEADEDSELPGGGGNGDEDTNMDVAEPLGGPLHAFPTATLSGEDDAEMSTGMTTVDGTTSKGIHNPSDSLSRGFEPQPRYAAQLMYNSKRKSFYIFGGNPANSLYSSLRLDDLWSLELLRPGLAEVLRKAKFKLRQQRFLELAHEQQTRQAGMNNDGEVGAGWGALQALVYLQTQVSQVVNHEIPEESQSFRKLMAHLLNASSSSSSSSFSTIMPPMEINGSPSAFSDFALPTVLLSSATPTEANIGATTSQSPTRDDRENTSSTGKVQSAQTSESGGSGGEEEEGEMLSISQVLPNPGATVSNEMMISQSNGLLESSMTRHHIQLGTEGKPSALYKQRYNLFKTLLVFFPSEAIEPDVDLLDCIEMSKLSL